MYDVKEHDEEKVLRGEAVKEKEAETRRIARELQEAEEKLKEGGDIYDDQFSLDFYTMKRVTEMRVAESVAIQQRKLDEIKATMTETHIILRRLEKENPKYSDLWIENYNRERSKTSLPNFIPSERQFESYELTSLEQLEQDFPEVSENVTQKMSTYGKKS
jgi:hypothetical protein